MKISVEGAPWNPIP